MSFADFEHALKKPPAVLREAAVPFLLGGSLASWARGGPESRHDLDLMIKEEDVDRALEALAAVGMRPERPPEGGLGEGGGGGGGCPGGGWVGRAGGGGLLVALFSSPGALPIPDGVIARGEPMSVLSMD